MQSLKHRLFFKVCVLALAVAFPALTVATESDNDQESLSLITESADEGFALAISLSRRSVTTIQGDKDVLHSERPVYSGSAEDLIAASHVVAVMFDTIAQANDYWRE